MHAQGGVVADDGEGRFEDGVAVVTFRFVEIHEALDDDLAVRVGEPADAAALQSSALGDVGEPVGQGVEAPDQLPHALGGGRYDPAY